MKRKKKKDKGFLFIYMKDEELALYGPDHYDTVEEAVMALWKDCKDIAVHEGRKPDEILQSCMVMLEDHVRFLWMKEAKNDHES